MRVSARSTARLALALVAAILLANLVSATMATLVFRDAVVQQGQETEGLVRRLLEDSQGALPPEAQAEQALLLQASERALEDMDRSTWVMVFAELSSSLFGVGLGVVLLRALKRLGSKEREVEQTVVQLRHSNADLDAFAGRVAHDLRNALAPMRMASGLLRRPGAGSVEVEKVAGILDRSSLRMAQLIDALLEFSRAEPPAAGARAEISAVVAGALEEVGPLSRQLQVKVQAEVSPATVQGASGALHALVANLLNNAVKFLSDQDERKVTVRGRPQGAEYALEIADTGPGIPREVQSRLFEPFFRAPGVKADGLGIGLATARRVVEALGGSIRVDSEAGRGATFIVRLPLAQPAGAA